MNVRVLAFLMKANIEEETTTLKRNLFIKRYMRLNKKKKKCSRVFVVKLNKFLDLEFDHCLS